MARKYLGVVATPVPSEKLFSATGNIVNAKRSSLDPSNVEKLVFYMTIHLVLLIYNIKEFINDFSVKPDNRKKNFQLTRYTKWVRFTALQLTQWIQ